MICRACEFDLRWVRMITIWDGDVNRVLTVTLECPQCGTSFRLAGVDQKALITITAPEKRSCLPENPGQELSYE